MSKDKATRKNYQQKVYLRQTMGERLKKTLPLSAE